MLQVMVETYYRQLRSSYRWGELADRPSKERSSSGCEKLPGWKPEISDSDAVAVVVVAVGVGAPQTE